MLVDARFVVDAAQLGCKSLDAELFAHLTKHSLFERFLPLPATTRQFPAAAAIAVADEQHPVISIEDHGGRPQVCAPADEVVVEAAQGGDEQAANGQLPC